MTILINIFIFSKIMLFSSLLIEKYYAGRYKHLVFSLLTVLMIGLAVRTEFVIMVLNAFLSDFSVKQLALIISGGIKNFLDGYYLIRKSQFKAIYGQASTFLKYARDDYETLRKFVELQVKGLKFAHQFLTIK